MIRPDSDSDSDSDSGLFNVSLLGSMKSAGDGQQWLQINAACGIKHPKRLNGITFAAASLHWTSNCFQGAWLRSAPDSDSDSDSSLLTQTQIYLINRQHIIVWFIEERRGRAHSDGHWWQVSGTHSIRQYGTWLEFPSVTSSAAMHGPTVLKWTCKGVLFRPIAEQCSIPLVLEPKTQCDNWERHGSARLRLRLGFIV
jgi:hypothetical protein